MPILKAVVTNGSQNRRFRGFHSQLSYNCRIFAISTQYVRQYLYKEKALWSLQSQGFLSWWGIVDLNH